MVVPSGDQPIPFEQPTSCSNLSSLPSGSSLVIRAVHVLMSFSPDLPPELALAPGTPELWKSHAA